MRETALHPHATAPRDESDPHRRSPQWRQVLGRLLAVTLLVAVAWFVVDYSRKVDWSAVREALLGYPLWMLAAAAAIAGASHMTYAAYDLLTRHCCVRHNIPPLKVFAVGLVSYAFNLNLGAFIGGLGFRWRLYSKLGLDPGQIGHIFVFSLVTNWGGYLLLGGLLLASGAFELPPHFRLPAELQQAVGFALLAAPLAYTAWCFTAKERSVQFRGRCFEVPPGRIAIAQLVLSTVHWLLMGSVVWLFMPAELGYGVVLGTLLSAAVAGVVVHVPGGLGVIEAVFLASLGDRVPEGTLIAGLLAYRAAFYLLPLVGAAALHFGIEAKARKQKRTVAA